VVVPHSCGQLKGLQVMSKVVHLHGFRNKDTVSVLREMLVKATRGEVSGLVFAAELTTGRQRVEFTGKFRSSPADAVKMAHHLGELLSRVEEDNAPTATPLSRLR
jgi:hypothetical protein